MSLLRRKPNPDPVTSQVWEEVVQRDLRIAGGCVAPKVDATAGECRSKWGALVLPYAREALTVDHIREEPGGQRRSLPRWLVTLCSHHHLDGWATAHRPLLRRYLEEHA